MSPGTYYVQYDTTPPVIILNGNDPQIVHVNTSYTEAGATVTDEFDTGLFATITGTVNTSVVGSYILTYNAVDSLGNAAIPVTRTVNVVDTSAPVITLKGYNPEILQVGTSYNEAGTTVIDNYDTGLFATITGNINIAVVGSYTLTYNAVDSSGNAAIPVTRTVNVGDTSAPVISINGNNPETIQVGTSYTESGATVTDNYDTGLFAAITGNVNTAVVGSYMLTYNALDSSGNFAIPLIRIVNVVDATPTLQVTGLVNDTPTDTTVNLSWNPTTNASHYQIYRNSILRGTTQNTYWNEAGLDPGTLYQYWIRANDSYNTWGDNSSILNVRTTFLTPVSHFSPEVAIWDTNKDDVIQKSEAINAVVAYFSGTITKANAISVLMVYFGG
jgi:hypothetical protein